MSNVNMTVNVDGDGGCCPPTCGQVQVRAVYVSETPASTYGPLSKEKAEDVVAVLAARSDIHSVTIEPVGA